MIDLATFTIRSEVRHVSRLTASYFHPTKSLLLFGFDTGEVCEYSKTDMLVFPSEPQISTPRNLMALCFLDAKFQKFSEKLPVHSLAVFQLEYLWNEAYCLSAGEDNKVEVDAPRTNRSSRSYNGWLLTLYRFCS